MMNEAKQMMIAQQKAQDLFNTVEQKGLIVAGKSEMQLCEEVVQLASDLFGVDNYWHKKIVRAGANTLQPFNGNPPDRMIEEDDILFLDFGPVFNGWEADLGRTYVIGSNPLKLKLKKDVEEAWYESSKWYAEQNTLTGAEYFYYVTELAKRYGYSFGNEIAGHIIGRHPHEQPDDPSDLCLDIHPDNHSNILVNDKYGNKRHWILEIQFVDRANNIGAFFEQLLN
jgi:Xaa-Pro aminopeptidase